MKHIGKTILRAFFPRHCIYCDVVTFPEDTACPKCAEMILRIEDPVCYRCGRPKEYCRCKARRRQFDRAVVAMCYKDGAEHAVLRLKKTDDADLVDTMAQEMTAALRAHTDAAALDMVTFVPMRKAELKNRGYNQSELLAKAVARELGIPCRAALVKRYDTKPQKSLSMIERAGNLLGVFDVQLPVADQRILLVDDLITTGSTLHECAKMLKIYDALSVTALTFAATIPKDGEGEEEE